MKVLFVVSRFHTNLFFATHALVDAGHSVEILALGEALLEDHSYVTPKIVSPGVSTSKLEEIIDKISPDVAFLRPASIVKADPEGLAEKVGAICRRRRTRCYLYTLRSVTRRTGLREKASFWLAGLPWQRVTPLLGMKRGRTNDRWAHYLPWPVENLLPTASERKPDERLRVLCVGKLYQPRKRQHVLLDAMQSGISTEKMDLTFVGAGGDATEISGYDPNHFALLEAAANSRPKSIRILEDVPFRQMAELYASHDICVLPAEREPLGTAPIEGMAYGCVPVISNECGSAGCIENGKTGYVVNTNNSDELKSVLEGLSDDRELCVKIGRNAKHFAETELSPALFVERVTNLAFGTSRNRAL